MGSDLQKFDATPHHSKLELPDKSCEVQEVVVSRTNERLIMQIRGNIWIRDTHGVFCP